MLQKKLSEAASWSGSLTGLRARGLSRDARCCTDAAQFAPIPNAQGIKDVLNDWPVDRSQVDSLDDLDKWTDEMTEIKRDLSSDTADFDKQRYQAVMAFYGRPQPRGSLPLGPSPVA